MSLSTSSVRTSRTAITVDDVLPPNDFERLRPKLQPLVSMLRRDRRCRVGAHATIAFENRETVLWHIQEILRVEGRTTRPYIEKELARYDCLVPRAHELRATVLIDGRCQREGKRLSQSLANGDSAVALRVGGVLCPAECIEVTPDVESPVRYVRFATRQCGIDASGIAHQAVEIVLFGETVALAPDRLRDALAGDLVAASLCGDAPTAGSSFDRVAVGCPR